MTFKPAFLTSAAAAAGVWFAAQAEPLADPALEAAHTLCGIDVAETGDGLVLTAWSAPEYTSNWRMVVTQRTGGGGFDIVQEGEVPAGQGPVVVSDLLLDTDTDFSARLTAWDAQGDPVCRIGDRI
ncbi:MAG: curli-like amyloid fiber formation chaperone CsgH [Pseudomonadota bacterium]|nr:curli-like amyloid fiber formation chaperone CsgH [Pseudomonadota bacterium]